MDIPIEAEQVNPAAAILPISEFLGYYHQIGREHRDAALEPPLKVFSLQQLFPSECRLLDFFNRGISNAEYSHLRRMLPRCRWSVDMCKFFPCCAYDC